MGMQSRTSPKTIYIKLVSDVRVEQHENAASGEKNDEDIEARIVL